MSKKRRPSTNTPQSSNTFEGGIVDDIRDFHLKTDKVTYARNHVRNSISGDLGKGGNEMSNVICAYAPYAVIGVAHITEDRWLVFSTNDVDSEIGEFRYDSCEYNRIVNDPCLNFKRSNLITAVVRSTFDCSYKAYWADGLNVDRTMDINNVPWVQECTTVNDCVSCVDTDVLDCEKLRLEAVVNTPCIKIKKGASAGSILNGSYHIHIAYTVNQQRVTDYSSMSNVLSLFTHGNVNNSLEIELDNLDTNFEEYELVLVTTIAEKTVAYNFGTYSTTQNKITIDFVDNTLPVVPLNFLSVQTPIADKSKSIFRLGKYLLRNSPTSKFDFNYQPLANQIQTLFQVVQYKKDYYKNGGVNVGHMRDEVYSYFIRFVYNTGDKSNSYHIPGRGPQLYDVPDNNGALLATVLENDDLPAPLVGTLNDLETMDGITPKVYDMFNTANITNSDPVNGIGTTDDGGLIIAEGQMGYWESTEKYDSDNPVVWNSNVDGRPEWDLCGKPIRHHKFPDNYIITAGNGTSDLTNHYAQTGQFIRVLGVKFENIQPPVDNDGNVIPNIVGYEILRGSRSGNKTVMYKGIINNMFKYDLPDQLTNRTGLYANYPFNSLKADPFLSETETSWESLGYQNYTPVTDYSKKHFTFHSPDCMFAKPFLSQQELKIYESVYGNTFGQYREVDGHPKHKFITDLTFAVSVFVGVGYAIAKSLGSKTTNYTTGYVDSDPIFIGPSSSPGNFLGTVGAGAIEADAGIEAITLGTGLTQFLDAFTGLDVTKSLLKLKAGTKGASAGSSTGTTGPQSFVEYGEEDQMPSVLQLFLVGLGSPNFSSNIAEGADSFMNLVRSLGKYRQFALQYQSKCEYNNSYQPHYFNRRRKVNDVRYLDRGIQDYSTDYIVNHALRNETVMFDTEDNVENVPTVIEDISRPPLISTISDAQKFELISRRASSHYVALKNRLRNQYGKIENIRQLPTLSCHIDISLTSTPVIFGGDTYIGKYSEKNTFFYFNRWLFGEPDGEEFDYKKYYMVNYPAFWMDTEPFDLAEFIQSISTSFQTWLSGDPAGFWNTLVTPSDKHCFDRNGISGLFMIKEAYMYLFQSGVRDFFVESEINIDYRDWEDDEARKHYPVLSDLKEMFHPSLIKADNYYKYDRSLSLVNLAYSKVSWSKIQEKNYNPFVSETCYVTKDKRLLYSLPQQTDSKKDNWSSFLANNYKDYSSPIVTVKPIDKTGGLIVFEREAPMLLPGVDELQTTSGVKITVGDGGLLQRDGQQLSNSERSLEYGSCQNALSVLNTPVGLYWMNVNQGRIFRYAGGLSEITDKDNRYWFNTFLPYQLLKDFPNFDLVDNPVIGIGCQTIYDNDSKVMYFCKRDFRLRPNLPFVVEYIGNGMFLANGIAQVELGDPNYFEDCSWTRSYDPKDDEFISFHDWKPSLTLTGKNSFVTVKRNGFWKHNVACNSYCNFYGQDYPYMVEFQLDTMPAVTILKSLEYYLEAYVYDNNCYDRHHVLSWNFDQAVIHNSEQCSGLLNLNLVPENDVVRLTQYPIVNLNNIDILYSKEEQKYRFNQFWDIVNNRQQVLSIWNTGNDGYTKVLNPATLNYQKNSFERKPMRHFNNRVLLIKNNNQNVKILVTLANVKLQNSPR